MEREREQSESARNLVYSFMLACAPTEVGNVSRYAASSAPTHVRRLTLSLLAVEFRGALLASLATFHAAVVVAVTISVCYNYIY